MRLFEVPTYPADRVTYNGDAVYCRDILAFQVRMELLWYVRDRAIAVWADLSARMGPVLDAESYLEDRRARVGRPWWEAPLEPYQVFGSEGLKNVAEVLEGFGYSLDSDGEVFRRHYNGWAWE